MEKVLILDFGSQYNQLIARRTRETGVYCEVKPFSLPYDQIVSFDPIAIILSGGPSSVYEEKSPKIDKRIFELGVPILGICYGAQLMAYTLGGKVVPADDLASREYGRTETEFDTNSSLFGMITPKSITWMSHGDSVEKLPEGFTAIAHSAGCPFAGFEDNTRRFYAVQFHPEVSHTQMGREILRTFLVNIAKASATWSMANYKQTAIDTIRAKVKDGKALLALSGGVDSSVAAALMSQAIGQNLTCVFVDHGLMRKDEGDRSRTSSPSTRSTSSGSTPESCFWTSLQESRSRRKRERSSEKSSSGSSRKNPRRSEKSISLSRAPSIPM